MAINMVLAKCKCACCGKQQTIEINESENVVETEVNLINYLDSKFISLNVCNNCGYVGQDISALLGKSTKAIVKSQDYQFYLDDGYIEGFEEVPYQEYEDFYVGIYDAMSYLLKKEGLENFTYVKVLHQIFSLKKTLCGTYFENKIDKDSEKWNPIYDDLINHLNNQAKNANEECIRVLKNLPLDNPFKVIFLAECLTNSYKYSQARELIESLSKKVKIEDDLQEYIDEFLTEVERV